MGKQTDKLVEMLLLSLNENSGGFVTLERRRVG